VIFNPDFQPCSVFTLQRSDHLNSFAAQPCFPNAQITFVLLVSG